MRNLPLLSLLLQWSPLLVNALPAPDYTVTVVDAASFDEYQPIATVTVLPIGTAANGAVTTYELSASDDDEIGSVRLRPNVATLIEGSAGYTLTFSNGDGFAYTAVDQCIFTGTVADCNRQNGLYPGELALTAGTEAVQAIATFTVSGNPPGLSSSATSLGPSSTHPPSFTIKALGDMARIAESELL
ncbi:hypothetical protein B0H19DRAFT_1243878 [Mycena capillaripes]|nr:hypothetical protein B0H19DRAFT_1243878 [Mycena capillaripes]